MSTLKCKRVTTDNNDTFYITEWSDDYMWVTFVDDEGERAAEFMLTKRDVEELMNALRRRD